MTRGLVTLQMLKLDAKPLVLEAVEQVRPLIQARSHYLAVHLPETSPFIQGDKKRLVQVIANLLTNAAKYTPEGGNIVLTMNVDGEHLNLSVSDDGIGMEPELINQAFKLFVQAERAPHRSQGGLGIGLALVKSLVELHNGQVSAFSKGNGKGTRFTVTLPTVNDSSADPGDSKKEPASTASTKQLKILVVDDNIDGAQMLAMLCEALGHEVVVEYTALRALELARNLTPDVCLLDIGLPDIDGYELASRLRAQSETANTILAAVTGYGQAQDRSHALAAGFDHHFVKPINITRLADLLKEVSESNSHS